MSSINTIGEDEYAVYNGRERPGIGRDHLGQHTTVVSLYLSSVIRVEIMTPIFLVILSGIIITTH